MVRRAATNTASASPFPAHEYRQRQPQMVSRYPHPLPVHTATAFTAELTVPATPRQHLHSVPHSLHRHICTSTLPHTHAPVLSLVVRSYPHHLHRFRPRSPRTRQMVRHPHHRSLNQPQRPTSLVQCTVIPAARVIHPYPLPPPHPNFPTEAPHIPMGGMAHSHKTLWNLPSHFHLLPPHHRPPTGDTPAFTPVIYRYSFLALAPFLKPPLQKTAPRRSSLMQIIRTPHSPAAFPCQAHHPTSRGTNSEKGSPSEAALHPTPFPPHLRILPMDPRDPAVPEPRDEAIITNIRCPIISFLFSNRAPSSSCRVSPHLCPSRHGLLLLHSLPWLFLLLLRSTQTQIQNFRLLRLQVLRFRTRGPDCPWHRVVGSGPRQR